MIHVLAHLYAGDGGLEALRAYEAQVLPLLSEHRGRLVSAFVPQGRDQPEIPDEIHLIAFPSEEALEAYRADPRIPELADLRKGAISQTVVYVSDEFVSYAAPQKEG